MGNELNRSAEAVDLNRVFTLLANEKDLSAVTFVAGLTRSKFKIIRVFSMRTR